MYFIVVVFSSDLHEYLGQLTDFNFTLSIPNFSKEPFFVAYSRTMASSDLFIYLSAHESQSRGLVSQRAL